jgi:5-amino-6-(5-phospho-D-ribitylamino)uracil phosphatase
MVELVAVDLDGTLLTSGKKITERTRRVLQAILNQGVKVLLASARPPRSVAAVYKALKLKDCIICYNGALIYDPPTRTVLAHQPIRLSLAKKVIQMAREMYPPMAVSVEVLDEWLTDRAAAGRNGEPQKRVPDTPAAIDSWLTCDVTKLLLLGPEAYLDGLRAKLNALFAHKLATAQSDHNLLQIMSAEVSKGNALKFVCKHYGIPLRRTIAIGDAHNDIDMLQMAGIGIAMADAPTRVKTAATYVTTGNDEDGVADALEKFVL